MYFALLSFILGYKGSEDQFLALTTQSAAVLCCRLTPSQKATIVAKVKEKLNMKTLSIGKSFKTKAVYGRSHLISKLHLAANNMTSLNQFTDGKKHNHFVKNNFDKPNEQ